MGSSFGRDAAGAVSRFSSSCAAAVLLVASTAHAEAPSGGRTATNGTGLVHPDPAGDAILIGRSRMAKGDCAGALEAFDAALRTSVDVTVRRDRGLCHEQLAHPFPAMDDFRAYLAAVPEASDADDIRGRLNQLALANGLGSSGTTGVSAVEEGPDQTGKLSDPFAVETADGAGKGARAVPAAGSGGAARVGTYEEELALNEKWDEADSSPLRRGTGLIFGVYGRGYGGMSNGLYGYGVGATLRETLGSVSTLLQEVGYLAYWAGNDDTSGVRQSGFSLGVGYEARIRLDQFATNALLIAGLVSYERATDTNSRALVNAFDPRGRFGYRHVFGPGFGLELAAEVARPLELSSDASQAVYVGGVLGALLGF